MQREEDGQRRGDDHACAGWGAGLVSEIALWIVWVYDGCAVCLKLV